MIKIETRVCLASINLWLKLNFYPQGLVPFILWDNFQSTWIKAIGSKFLNLSFIPSMVLKMEHDQAKQTLKQGIKDTGVSLGKSREGPSLLLINIQQIYCHCCQLPHTVRNLDKPNQLSVLSDAMLSPLLYWMTNIKIYYFQKGFTPVILQRWKLQNMFFLITPFTETLRPDWSFLWLADIPVIQTQPMPRWCS